MKDKIKKIENIVLMLLGLGMTAVMFANALSRYVLGSTFVWAEEVIRMLFVWAMFIVITDLFVEGGNIGFDVFANKNAVTKMICEIVTNIVLIIIGGSLFIHGGGIVQVIGKIPLAATKLPGAVFYIPGVIAGGVWVLIGAYKIVRCFIKKDEKEGESV